MELNCSAEISREVGKEGVEAKAKNEEIRDAEISTKVIFALNTNGTFVDAMISLFPIISFDPSPYLSTC